MRGRVGGVLVQVVRRALFWYTSQIRLFQSLVAESAREQMNAFQELSGRQERQQQMLSDLSQSLQDLTSFHEEERQRRTTLAGRLDQTDETLAEIRKAMESEGRELRQKIQHEKSSLLQLEVRLGMLLREIRKSRPADREPAAAPAIAEEVRHTYDSLFVDHALAFRGTREEIKSRLAVYAPYVRDAFAATQGAPAFDLGCGRGEWLELLREMDIPASGADWNRELIASCRAMGLDAREGGVPGVLNEVPRESLSVVSAFHVLEHVSFPDLLEVIDQALRVLKPGGIAIFETPNPKNIFVSTNSFYLDPTHRHPIPSDLLAFVVEARGFCDPKVIPLSVAPEQLRLAASECQAVQFINEHFYSAQDYGIVAFKM